MERKAIIMGIGIVVCGLNGAGKSTLGKILAEEMNFSFIDIENLYFEETDTDYSYPRKREEVQRLLLSEIKANENFVLASVKCDYGEAIPQFIKYAVLINVPEDIRMQRVRQRSFLKFGCRMQPGGDLYESEERFFNLVKSRKEETVEEWVRTLNCDVIRIDGTKSVEENVKSIIGQIRV